MCGIAGYLIKTPSYEASRKIPTLLKSIQQRGPDDEGVCLISRKKNEAKFFRTGHTLPILESSLIPMSHSPAKLRHDLALIHTRYSIIDLSSGGHQPFVSSDGAVVLIFNGEIYNFLELRRDLSNLGVSFRTSSDTEVLIEGYRMWGHEIWAKLNGFWAVALYDFSTRSFSLSRDRLGVAPFYYRETVEGVYFASSIQSLVDIDPETVQVDEDKVVGFIQTSFKDFDNSTLYHQVKSVSPATVITFDQETCRVEESKNFQYWSLPSSRLTPKDLSFDDAVTWYRDTFFDAVDLRLRADVKVAFELSGGLDSSSIVAAAAVLRNSDVTTFTIQVPEENEEPYARSMLEMYPGIDYRVLSNTEASFFSERLSFSRIMQEPFHSPNIYTHFKMRQQMKNHGVSVVLTGSGADQVIAGYHGQFWLQASAELWKTGFAGQAEWHEIAYNYGIGGWKGLIDGGGKRLKRIIRPLAAKLGLLTPLSKEDLSNAEKYQQRYSHLSFHEQVLFHWNIGLVPYYLRSNDHFTMGIPLEARAPFLDYRMMEVGLQMPVGYLFKDGWTKYILRKAMTPYMPGKILWRKEKMGFPFPHKNFLNIHRDQFEPMVSRLGNFWVRDKESRDYSEILNRNPLKLWRLCSTAFWLENIAPKSALAEHPRAYL
jgi:asparagine synthase (glutamine-hydrolysing)